ncbi:MAG: hypothetical protein ACR2N3_11490 [Pyrinomonadaceae bacterium]
MRSIGMSTIFIYIASLISFALAIQYAGFFAVGMALGALLFIVATITLLTMMKKRADKEDF